MKLAPPRLLPIVIAAAAALLLFKGIALVTGGSYVLGGASETVAQEHGAAPSGGGAGGEATLPTEPSMSDTSPTIEDHSVTMPMAAGGGEASGGHGGGDAAPAEGGEPAPAAAGGDHGAAPQVGPADAAAATACPPGEAAAPAAGAGGEHGGGGAAAEPVGPCLPDAGVNEHGDALPLIKDPSGNMVPLADVSANGSSEGAINARLGERRDALDQREKELDMRAALVEAAEKRLEERSAELKAMEAKISQQVDSSKAAEQQQFVGLVAMYENMKPKDASTIFNQLDMPVLLGVAKAMNPRKLAPVMARMDPMKAKALTDALAAADTPATADAGAPAAEDLTNLPQIVGQ